MDRSGTGGGNEGMPEDRSGIGKSRSGKFSSSRSNIVTARGTGDGLIIRLDARVGKVDLISALTQFLDSRRSFLEGNSVAVEWVGGEPGQAIIDAVEKELEDCFNVRVRPLDEETESTKNAGRVMRLADRVEREQDLDDDPALGLFGGIEGLDLDMSGSTSDDRSRVTSDGSAGAAFDVSAWDDPDARIVCKTLRSGQKIETEHTLVVVGDVNSGAELVAGGDIIVLGSLRGVAHAGAYDETGGGRFIIAMDLQPTQLRIGSIISRGSADGRNSHMEIARVDGNLIMVEPFNPRAMTGLKR
jgi:septum site-determining protein MinC